MLEEWGGLGGVVAIGLLLAGIWFGARGTSSERSRGSASAVARSRAGAAADTLLRVVHAELERGHNEAAVAHWLALGAAGLEMHAGATLAIRMAALLRDGGRNEEAAAALRCALRSCDGPTGSAVAVRVARAAMDLDSGLALDACAQALASDALDPLDRRDLELLQATPRCAPRIEPGNAPHAADPDPASADPGRVAAAAPADASIRPEPIELGHHARRLVVELALPLAFEPAGLRVALAAGEQRVLAWREIDAIAVGAVEGLGSKPVLVVDLVAGWRLPPSEPLRIVRLRGDRFDPRKVVGATGSPVDALRELVDRLLGETGAEPLPDLRAARGRPFAGFRDLTAFEEDVLVAEEGGSAGSRARPGDALGPA
jgi:hypothetical protein